MTAAPLFTAASNLGYDQDEWNSHSKDPKRTSGPPDNLVLDVENYLEGEAYLGTFWWTQVCCILIMICVSLPEIRNLILWGSMLPKPKGPTTESFNPLTIVKTWGRWLYWFYKRNPSDNFKDLVKTWFVRLGSMAIALGSYVVIPVLLVMVSILLILESGSVLDVIKDTLSLLFLNEINNYLQVRNAPDGFKWTIKFTHQKAVNLMRQKNIFTCLLVGLFGALAAVTTKVVYTGSAAASFSITPQGGGIKIHPSILFNLARFRSFWDGFVSWAVFLVLLGLVGLIYYVTQGAVWVVEFLESRPPAKKGDFLYGFVSLRRKFARAFDDSTAYDEKDWTNEAVPFEELAEAYEEEARAIAVQEAKEEKAEAERLEAERLQAARDKALDAQSDWRPPPPKNFPPAPEPTMVTCF